MAAVSQAVLSGGSLVVYGAGQCTGLSVSPLECMASPTKPLFFPDMPWQDVRSLPLTSMEVRLLPITCETPSCLVSCPETGDILVLDATNLKTVASQRLDPFVDAAFCDASQKIGILTSRGSLQLGRLECATEEACGDTEGTVRLTEPFLRQLKVRMH